MVDIKLDSKFFDKFFHQVNLGAYPDTDKAETEESLASAIGKIWSKSLELEFQDDLWLSKLIGTKPRSAIITKDELTVPHLGDTMYISKAAGLSAEGNLGTDHSLKDDEENLDLSRISLHPVRVGNAVKFRTKAAHSVSFKLREEIRALLADWAAEKIEKLIIAGLEGCSEAHTLFAGTSNSKETLTQTDTILASDLLRLYVSLLESKAKGISELGGYFALIMSPRQWYDLCLDPVFMSTVAAASVGKSYDWEGFVGSYSHFRLFTSNLVHSQISEASPGVDVYSAYALGARAACVGWEQHWSWLKKGSSGDYGESDGVGSDAWVESKILNQKYLYKLQSCATSPK